MSHLSLFDLFIKKQKLKMMKAFRCAKAEMKQELCCSREVTVVSTSDQWSEETSCADLRHNLKHSVR